jgi:hypothetical protein
MTCVGHITLTLRSLELTMEVRLADFCHRKLQKFLRAGTPPVLMLGTVSLSSGSSFLPAARASSLAADTLITTPLAAPLLNPTILDALRRHFDSFSTINVRPSMPVVYSRANPGLRLAQGLQISLHASKGPYTPMYCSSL